MGAHEEFGMETRSCAPGPITYWVWTTAYTRTFRSIICNTAQIITSSWDVSRSHKRRSIRTTLEISAAYPFDHREIRATRTACLYNSVGWYPNHRGVNASTRHGYHQRPGTFFTRVLQCTGSSRMGGHREPCGASSARSEQASRGTSDAGRRNQGLLLSPSSRTT